MSEQKTKFYAIFDASDWHPSAYAVAKALEDNYDVKVALFTDSQNKKAAEDTLKHLGLSGNDIATITSSKDNETMEAKFKAVLPLAFKDKINFIIIPTTVDSKQADPIGAAEFAEAKAPTLAYDYLEEELEKLHGKEKDPATKTQKINESRNTMKISAVFPNKFLTSEDARIRRRKYGLEKFDDAFKSNNAKPEDQPPGPAAPQQPAPPG